MPLLLIVLMYVADVDHRKVIFLFDFSFSELFDPKWVPVGVNGAVRCLFFSHPWRTHKRHSDSTHPQISLLSAISQSCIILIGWVSSRCKI